MIGLIQRVSFASTTIDNTLFSSINAGILLLLAIEKGDDKDTCHHLLQKIIHFRIFVDTKGKMNLSLLDTGGELMIISQFTLAANTNTGKRPSFSTAMPPTPAKALYEYFCEIARHQVTIQTGTFGMDMQITLCNDGPATFYLKV